MVTANGLLQMAVFFAQLLLMRALTVDPLYLLKPPKLILQILKSKFLARTPREVDEAYAPGPMDYGKFVPQVLLSYIIALTYAPTNPVVMLPCAMIYFAMAYIIWKYQVMYVLCRGVLGPTLTPCTAGTYTTKSTSPVAGFGQSLRHAWSSAS